MRPPVLYHAGKNVPLFATSFGRVLLAYTTPEFRRAYLAREHVLEPEGKTVDAAELADSISRVRLRGFAQMTRPIPSLATSVAAPIRDASGDVVAALSVLGPGAGPAPASLEEAVIAATRAISRDLRAARSAT